MIDFLDVTIPFTHSGVINNGYKDSNKKDGTSNRKFYPQRIKGRNKSYIQVVSEDKHYLRIIGNPSMFIQGQNVFGPDNIKVLTLKVAQRIAKQLGVILSERDKMKIKSGNFDVHRLDITYNFDMGSQETKFKWLDEAAKCIGSGKQLVSTIRPSTAKHVETIMLGQSSSYISVKFYNKYESLRKFLGSKGLAEPNPVLRKLLLYAMPLLRCEIRLQNQYLKKYGLTKASALTPKVLSKHYFGKLGRISFGTSKMLPVKDVKLLTKNEKLGYQLWLRGGDVKAFVSPSTFARLRKALLKFDLDLRLPFVKQVAGRELDSYLDPNNIAKPPRFLSNTSWLFNPE